MQYNYKSLKSDENSHFEKKRMKKTDIKNKKKDNKISIEQKQHTNVVSDYEAMQQTNSIYRFCA